MTPQDLIAAFETLADAPDGTTRLRELVLQLAVRGKLVAQDPSDEPAAVLLERIAAEKARLVKEKKIRKPKVLPPIEADEVPFAVPEGWEWCRFGSSHINRDAERIPLKSADRKSRHGPYDYYGASGAIDKIDDYIYDGDLLLIGEDGANLVLRSTPIAFMATGKFWVNNHAHVLDSVDVLSLRYLAIYINSIDLKPYLTGIAQPKLNQKKMNAILTALPPLAEQHRIVAKVDALMGLLDRLEAARDARDTTRASLRDAALAALSDAEDTASVELAWTRIAEHMDDLFTDPADVAPLRQTILQLAVRGRLVPQDASDAPAAVLLERIAAEKARLVKEKKIRKPKVLPPIEADEVPFEVPEGWAWTRLGRLGAPEDNAVSDGPFGSKLKKSHYVEQSGFRVVRLGNIGVGTFKDIDRSFIEGAHFESLSKYHLQENDLVIASLGNPVGRACLIPSDCLPALNKADCFRVRLHQSLAPTYVRLVMNSPMGAKRSGGLKRGDTRGRINLTHLRLTPTPIPPLAEQHRIVAKVDALMALCDDLEARLTAARTTRGAFAAAAVHHLDA